MRIGYSSVAEGIKGNINCLSGSVLSAGIKTVDIEAENLFLLFIVWASYKFRCCIILLIQELINLLDRYSLYSNLITYKVVLYILSISHKLSK